MIYRTVKVWDPLLRLFHWGLVASFALAWMTAENRAGLHEWAGYAAAALIGFRLVWGLIGPHYARFTQFIRSPATVFDFVKAMIRRDEPRYVGHNPAGSVMILGLITAMGVTAVTGWMYTLDAFWGLEWVEETHELFASLMLGMVVIHVAGVLYASYAHQENLVKSMVTGSKRISAGEDIK